MENNEEDFAPPSGVISIKEAIALNDEWTKTRCNAMDGCITKVSGGKVTHDNRSSWWSIEDLEAYIKYAKSQTKKKVTGLRIYCGAYNNPDNDGNFYATSFIVPTTGEGSLGKDTADGGPEDLPIPPLNVGHQGDPPEEEYTGG